jgi:BirA family biotin operon repressor/biotin-[acetyl-CoA-carboxylase] ligase
MSDDARMPFGRPHRHLRRTGSTNDVARELAAGGAPGGLVVTADEQTEGRGRQGRSWLAPSGGALLCSYVLRPLGRAHALLPLAVPLAVCEVAEELGADDCRVKWPNDVWLGERKLAGILIEARPQAGWAVIGVGLNVAVDPEALPTELRDRVASIDGQATVAAALDSLDRRLADWADAEPGRVLQEFGRRDALHGREVTWDEGEGTADGVDERGNLVVLTADGQRLSLGAGEVHLSVGSSAEG